MYIQLLSSKADMVSLHSLEEHKFVVGLHGGSDPWLGGRRHSGNNFVWSDGTPWDYNNWAPFEPNNSRGVEDCVHMSDHLNLCIGVF